jgi:predicted dehydrogenase
VAELRAEVIGAGFVGRAHIEALRRLGIPIAGVLGSSPKRGQQTSRMLGLSRAYDTIQELAADENVDVVHVCTPNHLHYEQVCTLLRSGKHVMCEKPLAMDTMQSADLVKLAQSEARIGGVTYNLRYYPLCQEARSLIASGAIGEPRLVHGGFLQDWLFYPTDWNWRLEPQLGGELRAVSSSVRRRRGPGRTSRSRYRRQLVWRSRGRGNRGWQWRTMRCRTLRHRFYDFS